MPAQPQQQQQPQPPTQQSRQRQSPNVTPPLRPLLPGGPNSGYNNTPSLFPPSVASQFPPGMRSFANDPRFPMPGHPAMGPPQTHVSSSTHPNMGGNGKLRKYLL
jgi:hypothetical protein